MTTLRLILTVIGSAVAAGFTVLLSAAASIILAIATHTTIALPFLVEATPGNLAAGELVTTEFASPGATIWFVALTIAFAAVVTVAARRRARHSAVLTVTPRES